VNDFNPLQPGEPIGVVALSGPVERTKLEEGLAELRSWGHPVVPASNLTARDRYLAGTDDARLEGLVELLDGGARTIIAARGGYGVTRLMDRLPWKRLADGGIRFVGFSDLTCLLNPLAASSVQIHGPMVAAGLARPANARRLKDLLEGRLVGGTLLRFDRSAVLRHGKTDGVVLGGNLSMLVSLLGTPWEPDFTDRVLVIEEVSEPPYRLDRMLTHLGHSASFSRVKALICGSLYACRPHAECLKTWSERVCDLTGREVPVVAGLPFGHGVRNLALPLGVRVDVDTDQGAISWSA
jgi:muramoyltetrapeptide carboxypeptidase